jgi:hypothetical protein
LLSWTIRQLKTTLINSFQTFRSSLIRKTSYFFSLWYDVADKNKIRVLFRRLNKTKIDLCFRKHCCEVEKDDFILWDLEVFALFFTENLFYELFFDRKCSFEWVKVDSIKHKFQLIDCWFYEINLRFYDFDEIFIFVD